MHAVTGLNAHQRHKLLPRVLMAVVVGLTSAQAGAQDPTPASATDRPGLSVKLALQPARFGILDDFQVVATVTNDTDDAVAIRDKTICFEPEFVRARGIGANSTCVPMHCTASPTNGSNGRPGSDARCETGGPIEAGASRPLRHYERVQWSDLARLSDRAVLFERYPALLGWVQRSLEVTVEIRYSGGDGAIRSVYRQTTMDVSASLVILLAGVVAGAALLAAFSLAHARRQDRLAPAARVGHAFRLFTAGSVTGVIFVILIQRIGDLDLPFKFAVNDIIGGLIVGLLSFKLSDTLYANLFGDARRQADRPPSGDPARIEPGGMSPGATGSAQAPTAVADAFGNSPEPGGSPPPGPGRVD